MALSQDCIDYRDRQQMRTQRWILWGVLGAMGVHAGVIPLWRWLPSDAAQLTTKDRIQLTVMPPQPEEIADDAASADPAAPSAVAPTDIAAPSPSSQSSISPPSAVAVAPAIPPPAIEDTVSSPAETADEEVPLESESGVEEPETEEPPELAENISEPEFEEPEIAEPAIEESNHDADNADALASEAEPTEAEPELDSAITDPAVDEVDSEIATVPDADETAIDEAASAALTGNRSAVETSASGFADALSRLFGNGETPTAEEAEPTGGNGAATPNGPAINDVARNTGPDEPASTGTGTPGDDTAPGTSANDSRTVSCRQCGRPDYPATALDAGIEGQPIVRAQFDGNGNVIGVTLERPSGNAALDQAALSAVRNWQFDTGGQSGSVPVEIPFVIEGSEQHQEAQQQGDRDAATVRDEAPAADSSPANQPVHSAADTPESSPNELDGIVTDSASDDAVTGSSPTETDNAPNEDATADNAAEPEATSEIVNEPEPSAAEDTSSPTADNPESFDNTPEPVPEGPSPEPELPTVEPENEPAASSGAAEDSSEASE